MSGSRGKRKRSQGRAASSSGTPMAAEGTLVEEASGRRRRTTRRPPTGAEAEHAASLQVRSHSLRRRMQGRRLHLADVGAPWFACDRLRRILDASRPGDRDGTSWAACLCAACSLWGRCLSCDVTFIASIDTTSANSSEPRLFLRS